MPANTNEIHYNKNILSYSSYVGLTMLHNYVRLHVYLLI